MPIFGSPFRDDVRRALSTAIREVGVVLRKLLVFFPIAVYFYAWSWKTQIRIILKVTSLTVLSISTGLLALEMTSELVGSERLAAVAIGVVDESKHYYLPYFVFGAALFLFWHHFEEARKPGYEYNFVQELCQLLETRSPSVSGTPAGRVVESLQLFHGVFRRAGVIHVSIYTPRGSDLVILPEHVYPVESDLGFFVPLVKGEGVAGRVFKDMHLRYCPRLYFPFGGGRWWTPSFLFPHAVKFGYQKNWDSIRRRWRLRLTEEKLDLHAFKFPEDGTILFQSFLSVPLRNSRDGNCEGVLNFDFNRVDPLDKADIAMAVVFGLLLAEEIR